MAFIHLFQLIAWLACVFLQVNGTTTADPVTTTKPPVHIMDHVMGCDCIRAISEASNDGVNNSLAQYADSTTDGVTKSVSQAIKSMIEKQLRNFKITTNEVTESSAKAAAGVSSESVGKIYNFSDSCAAHQAQNSHMTSGVNRIYPLRDQCFGKNVWCNADTDGGRWTVFQRRVDGSVDFNRNWTEYERGFGDLSGEHWLGLSTIHHLTSLQPTSLRVDMWCAADGSHAYAFYQDFTITGPEDNYRLHVSGYHGTTEDSMDYSTPYKHNNQQFTTWDRDNDKWDDNCADRYPGGWWFEACVATNLNARYEEVWWYRFCGNGKLKKVEMKLRPRV